jgi:pyruvate dehydrogenase E1 component alpha subunit
MDKINELKNLGDLVDPRMFQDRLVISKFTIDQNQDFLRTMTLIRKVEQKLAIGRRDGLIGGPVHLGVGQEAVAVGVSTNLNSKDAVFGAHRSHSHLLALGSSVRGLFAEVLGKETGASKGMGGSMHLWDESCGFYGSVPIVSGTVSLAVGAALAAKMKNTANVSVAYFGDGAVEEGVVHESLNLARMLNAPVLFVVENNLFASHMHISQRQPSDCVSRFAAANAIPYRIVDGNDVAQVATAASELLADARGGKGPGFLEAVTYRWFGHVDWREDVDVGVNRSIIDLENWRARDPIARLRSAMMSNGMWTEDQDNALMTELDRRIDSAWIAAMQDPYPAESALLDRVYAPENM